GLVTTLGPGARTYNALWMSAEVGPTDVPVVVHGGFRTGAVGVTEEDYRAFYDVISNKTLWYCLHGLWDRPRLPRFDSTWHGAWGRFRAVNMTFARAAADKAARGATVLVQDYHLSLVPGMLRDLRPDLRVSCFLHTPWCSPAELATLPDAVVVELLSGLSSGGSVGFHSSRWAEAFAACCEAVLDEAPDVFVSPAAADRAHLDEMAGSADCSAQMERLDRLAGGRQLIARVDRIEPSKNILRGLWAYDEMLESLPEVRGEVVLGAFMYPSRAALAEYQAYRQEVITLANRVNDRWATKSWTPILFDTDDSPARSVAALRRADVLLVNPVRDGLNLVAMEGALVSDRHSTLVLSREAGCADELGGFSLVINPFDVTATAAALAAGLLAPEAERVSRAEGLRKAASARTPLEWFDSLLASAI
ncbi:MAG: trehalose-6-phosphate synthase, partial [Acidimicrobiales bacterium]